MPRNFALSLQYHPPISTIIITGQKNEPTLLPLRPSWELLLREEMITNTSRILLDIGWIRKRRRNDMWYGVHSMRMAGRERWLSMAGIFGIHHGQLALLKKHPLSSRRMLLPSILPTHDVVRMVKNENHCPYPARRFWREECNNDAFFWREECTN